MQMSVGLEVSPEDQARIRDHLRTVVRDEAARGYRFLALPVASREPELSYAPLFLGGTGKATTFDPSLQIAARGEAPISTTGMNVATFAYNLTESGARLMKQSLEQRTLPIFVSYEGLKLVARIPSVTIRIHGNRSEFVREVQEHMVALPYLIGGMAVTRMCWFMPVTMDGFRNTYQHLKVEVDDGDFREADPDDDVGGLLEGMALRDAGGDHPSVILRAGPAARGGRRRGRGAGLLAAPRRRDGAGGDRHHLRQARRRPDRAPRQRHHRAGPDARGGAGGRSSPSTSTSR